LQQKTAKKNIFRLDHIIRYTIIIIPVGVAGHILFSLLNTDRGIFRSLGAFSFQYLAVAVVLGLIPWLTNTIRVYNWTQFLGKKYSFRDMFTLTLACELGAGVSPTAVGGGYVKMAMLIQKGMPSGAAASIMSLGSVEDIFFFLIAIPGALIWTSAFRLHVFQDIFSKAQDRQNFFLFVVLGMGILVGSALVLRKTKYYPKILAVPFFAKWHARIKKFWRDFISIYALIRKKGKTRFAVNLLLTSVQWISRCSVIVALLACFHVPLYPVEFFIFQWIIYIVGTFTPTPGGSVGVEAAFYFIYKNFIPADMMALAVAGWRILTYYLQLSLGVVLFSGLQFKYFSNERILPYPTAKPVPGIIFGRGKVR